MVVAALAQQCAGDLAGLAEKLMDKVPDSKDWGVVRKFLRDTVRLLRQGNIMAGVTGFQRILPYIGKALNHVDRYMKATDTYEVTESISQHFLVDEESREAVEKFLRQTKVQLTCLREGIESFGLGLDEILENVIQKGETVGFMVTLKLTFTMNRLSAQILVCEDRLQRARAMIDEIDTHVAGKSLLANLLTYIAFLGSVAFSATGNLPAGAACLATATASRKSAQGISEYRKKLAEIDRDHKELQSQLREWHLRFRAEQRNFLLLFGVKYAIILLIIMAAIFLILGKAANFLFFSVISIYLVVKSEETNKVKYYAGVAMAILAAVVEFKQYQGLIAFNTGAAILLTIQFCGFLEII